MFRPSGLLVLVVLFAFCGTALARPDKNSFLNHRVRTVAQLLRQVKTDQQVRDRFERHFAMNQEQLFAYIGGLHRAKIQAAANYTVYSIPPDGHVKAHTERLRRGTAIFADSKGHPILLVKCGNPMTRGPNQPAAANLFKPILSADADLKAVGLGEGMPTLLAEDAAQPADVVLPEVALAPPTAPAPPVIGESAIPLLAAAPNLRGLLALLPLIGLHGGGGGGVPPRPPTPEPSTFVLMGVATTALILRARRSI